MQRVEAYPRSQRYMFGRQIEDLSLGILSGFVNACYAGAGQKNLLLAKISCDIDVLRYFLRLSMDLGLLTLKQYTFAIEALADIGRQVGGWKKQVLNQ